jgi:hypothetical protein
MSKKTPTQDVTTEQLIESSDAVWGAENIGAVIDRDAPQVRNLYKAGVLKGAVQKVGHRTFLGSRKKLRQLTLG